MAATTTRFSPINVGRLPGRKQPCLFEIDGQDVRVLARFTSEDAAKRFLAYQPRVNQAQIGSTDDEGDEG